jgi:hypothetical protein
MDLDDLGLRMRLLNDRGMAVIFIITGPNGSGKTVLTKRLLTALPFHQTFNLGAITKTIRYMFHDAETTRLENFKNDKTTSLFTPIVQFACAEYQRNGVNVIIDGVQIDTSSEQWSEIVTGGAILEVSDAMKVQRNNKPETHFNRSMELHLTNDCSYSPSDIFRIINNNGSIDSAFNDILAVLSECLDRQLMSGNPAKSAISASSNRKSKSI